MRIPPCRNWEVLGRGPRKSEDAESLEADTVVGHSTDVDRIVKYHKVREDVKVVEGVWSRYL